MIKFVCGRSGRGKTTYIFNMIENNMSLNKKYLIVPDQMSFQTQLSLINHVPNNILANVEVMGFKIFIKRISELLNLKKIEYLDEFSKKILLQHTLLNHQNIYKDNLENIDFINDLYKFLKENNLNNDQLTNKSINSLNNAVLKKKMLNISSILKYFYSLDEDLKEVISDCCWYNKIFLFLKDKKSIDIFSKIDIYIDSYTSFSFIQKEIFAQVLKIANDGAISFNIDIKEKKYDKNIFEIPWNDYIFFKNNIANSEIINLSDKVNKNRFTKNKTLDYLEKNFDKRFDKCINLNIIDDNKTIFMNSYNTIDEEVCFICKDIRKKIINSSINSSNFALYIPNNDYLYFIDKYFSLYDIPYYIDIKVPFLEFPFFKWLFIMNEFYRGDWSSDNIMSLIRNDFFLFNLELDNLEIDLFVDYIDDYIAENKKEIWLKEDFWVYYNNSSKICTSINEEKTILINKVRKYIYNYIISFEDIFKNEYRKNKDFLFILYNFFIRLNLKEYIHNFLPHKSSPLMKIQNLKDNIWNEITKIFDQLINLVGEYNYVDSYMSKYIKLSLEENYFVNYPSSFDGVMIGDYYRTRFQNIYQEDQTMGIKHLYLLGMNADLYPYIDNNKKLFSDEEIIELSNNKIINISSNEPKNNIDFSVFNFYILATSPKETLNISYFLNSDEGHQKQPSPILNIFSKIGIKLKGNINNKEKYLYYNLNMAKKELIYNFRYNMIKNTYLFQIVKYIEPKFISDILKYSNNHEINDFSLLDVEKKELTVTQIEDYNTCPYKFFLRYILGFEVKHKPTKIKTYQIGNILHDFFEFIGKCSLRYNKKLSDIKCIEEITKDYLENYNNFYLEKHPINKCKENKYIIKKIIDNIKKELLTEFIKLDNNSNFRLFNIEKTFTMKLNNYNTISCKVDRIDVDKDYNFFRIIDYKTYDKKVSFNDIYNGTQLQLPLYSYIVEKKIKKKWSGYSYLCINNSYDTNIKKNAEYLFFKNNGFYYKDLNNLLNYDNDLLVNKNSSIIKCKINNSGDISNISHTIDKNELDDINKYVYEKTINTVENINKKKFNAHPIINNKNEKTLACKYCCYKNICSYSFKKELYNNKTVDIDSNNNFNNKINSFLTKIKKREEI